MIDFLFLRYFHFLNAACVCKLRIVRYTLWLTVQLTCTYVTLGRQATEKERTHGGVLKDMDLVIDKTALHLGSKKAAFMVQVEKDANFLAELNIMDYSLLVRLHHHHIN